MAELKMSLEDKSNDETLGMYLVRARKAAGISRETLAQTTHIYLEIISNIENSDWKKFPVEAYARGYLNSICSKLELDKKKVLEWFSVEYGSSYTTDFKAEQDVTSPMILSKKLADESAGNSKTVLIVLLILLVIAFLAVMNFMKKTENAEIPPVTPVVVNTPVEDTLADSLNIPEGAEAVPVDSMVSTKADFVKAEAPSLTKRDSIKPTKKDSLKYSSATTFLMSSNSAPSPAVVFSKNKTHVVISGNGKAISWVGIKKHAADSLFVKEANLSSVTSEIEYTDDDTLFVVIGNPAGIGKLVLNGIEVAVPVRKDGRTTRLCLFNGNIFPGVH